MSTYNKYYVKTVKTLKNDLKENDIITPEDYKKLYNKYLREIRKKIKDVDIKFAKGIFNEQFKLSLIFNPTSDTRLCLSHWNEISHKEVPIPSE